MSDEQKLKEIQERFDHAQSQWREIRAEGAKDMLCVAGDVWSAVDPNGKAQRQTANRPALNLDELGQHFNQVINAVRANPRSPKFSPTDKPASKIGSQFYEDKWREIEYRSHAQLAYIAAFENTIQRGYGFVRVCTKYGDKSFDQDIWIEGFPNPDMVLPDPEALKPDSSDMRYCFVYETWRRDDFLKEYPRASKRNLDVYMDAAPKWIQPGTIMLAEYWCVEKEERELLQLRDPQTGQVTTAFADDMQQMPSKGIVLQRKPVMYPRVYQHLTNGIEILNTVKWPGKYIPIVSCYGKVLYLTQGGKAERQILSMTRLARDPFMLYCYTRTCEAEAIGGVPRNAWIGYQGQFVNPQQWAKASHEPVAYLEALARTEGAGPELLPLPQRQPWDPPLQNLEIAAEASRRAIMSAMGITPLPTAAQRQNEKSGVALKKIDDQQQRGSFHFVDHYNDMLRQVGVIGEDLMDKVYDTARTVGIRKANDSAQMVRINDPDATDDKGQPNYIQTAGDYIVTISEGPSFDSERDEAREFVTNFVSSPSMELVPPPIRPKFLAEAIRAQDLGTKGDALADILDPKEGQGGDPQMQLGQAKQMIDHLQQQLQAAGKIIETKQVEQQAKIAQTKIQTSAQLQMHVMDNATKIAVARISAAKGALDVVKEDSEEALALAQQQTHEAQQNQLDRDHEMALAQQQHQQALAQAQQAHEQAMTQAEQGQAHALQQGQQGIQGQLEVQDNAPQPQGE